MILLFCKINNIAAWISSCYKPDVYTNRKPSRTVLIYILCACLTLAPLILPNQCLPAVCISLQQSDHTHAADAIPGSSPAAPGSSSKLDHRRFISPDDWGNNYKVAWGERLLCIGIALMVLPRAMYFTLHHVGWKKMFYFTPLALAERERERQTCTPGLMGGGGGGFASKRWTRRSSVLQLCSLQERIIS